MVVGWGGCPQSRSLELLLLLPDNSSWGSGSGAASLGSRSCLGSGPVCPWAGTIPVPLSAPEQSRYLLCPRPASRAAHAAAAAKGIPTQSLGVSNLPEALKGCGT